MLHYYKLEKSSKASLSDAITINNPDYLEELRAAYKDENKVAHGTTNKTKLRRMPPMRISTDHVGKKAKNIPLIDYKGQGDPKKATMNILRKSIKERVLKSLYSKNPEAETIQKDKRADKYHTIAKKRVKKQGDIYEVNKKTDKLYLNNPKAMRSQKKAEDLGSNKKLYS